MVAASLAGRICTAVASVQGGMFLLALPDLTDSDPPRATHFEVMGHYGLKASKEAMPYWSNARRSQSITARVYQLSTKLCDGP